jgi:hypothetical protein
MHDDLGRTVDDREFADGVGIIAQAGVNQPFPATDDPILEVKNIIGLIEGEERPGGGFLPKYQV